MKTAAMMAAAALGLSSCASISPMPPSGPTTVTVANKAPYGPYLVGYEGRSLYMLEGTRNMSGRNRCSGPCLLAWPLVRAAVPGPGVDPAKLATVPGYGGPHAAYAGWPLYYYHRDGAPGDTTGQHVTDLWGTWHLVSPSGEPIRPAGHH